MGKLNKQGGKGLTKCSLLGCSFGKTVCFRAKVVLGFGGSSHSPPSSNKAMPSQIIVNHQHLRFGIGGMDCCGLNYKGGQPLPASSARFQNATKGREAELGWSVIILSPLQMFCYAVTGFVVSPSEDK